MPGPRSVAGPGSTVTPIARPSRLKEVAYDEIKRLLTSEPFDPEVVFSANQFAVQFGISRTPVRDALLQLEAEGFLVANGGLGFKIRRYSQKEILDCLETRELIETYVVGKRIAAVASDELEVLKGHIQRMAENAAQSGSRVFIQEDYLFHQSLVGDYGNLMLGSIMNNLRDLITMFGRQAFDQKGRREEIIQEHQDIVQALEAKDKRAAVKAVRVHLAATKRCLMEALGLESA